MTGHSGVQYDDDRQTAAAPKVVETWDAVDGSRSGAEALRTAQMSSVWGHEDGPVAMRTRATDMFDTISELLAAERDLIQEFEVYMHQAMKEFRAEEDHVCLAQQLRSKELFSGTYTADLRAHGRKGINRRHRQGYVRWSHEEGRHDCGHGCRCGRRCWCARRRTRSGGSDRPTYGIGCEGRVEHKRALT